MTEAELLANSTPEERVRFIRIFRDKAKAELNMWNAMLRFEARREETND